MRLLGLALAGGLWLAPAAAPAQDAYDSGDPANELRTLEQRLAAEQAAREDLKAKREALAEELRTVRAQVIDSAAAVQDAEETVSRLEQRLAALHAERDRIANALDMRDEHLARIMTAIQRLAWRPTEALLIQPASPAETVRSAILLRAAIPLIEDRARQLAREMETLSGLDAAITAQRAEIARETDTLKAAHGRLEALFDRKAALQRDTLERERQAERRVEQLGREASDLRDLVNRLRAERHRADARRAYLTAMDDRRAGMAAREAAARAAEAAAMAPTEPDPPAEPEAARPDPPAPLEVAAAPAPVPPRAFASGKGAMPMPARGRIITRYGQPDDVGSTSKGVTIQTRADARVVAPFDGTVAFAGPFRGYGLLLIIEHTDGYHSLLSGMARLDVGVGQALKAGEPVGVMGGDAPTLYVELRRKGRTINPLPWLVAGSDSGKG
jgi:septal ring factor EnvC (AmiA/AmiB activator)